ncbi:hypothetical protein IF188_14010 [Microbacterium sp. NEAU-LLC]|uniref:Uncharacterized protein n=1 Tax=Microbacterium helvum TaxID=2773713 RepID=A0ABR8NQ98_9MICO|nr:hypothetical protein [Microbacterium helvum]MBD3942811.1 hypothetical protein [Microbacterium helvum]
MIPQPSQGDGEKAWRQYAGDLRHMLGDASQLIEKLERDVERKERALRDGQRRGKKIRWLLNRAYRELIDGDTPAAIRLLAAHRPADEGASQSLGALPKAERRQ